MDTMRHYLVLLAALILLSLTACTVSLNVAPGSVVVYVQPQSGVWTDTGTPEPTPTPETPTEFPTPRYLMTMRNVTPNRYSIRQCPSVDCTRVGWLLPDELIEVDETTSTGEWIQAFRDDVEVGWVWRAALDYEHG